MCLIVNKEKSQKFYNDNKDKEFVYCYKVLLKDKFGLYSPIYHYEWVPGKHKSNLNFNYTLSDQKNKVTESFHFFLKKEDAERYIYLNNDYVYIIVKMKCFMKNFVAVGLAGNYESITFTEVELEEEEFNKCSTI